MNSVELSFIGKMAEAKANLSVYLNHPVGVGEHSSITDEIKNLDLGGRGGKPIFKTPTTNKTTNSLVLRTFMNQSLEDDSDVDIVSEIYKEHDIDNNPEYIKSIFEEEGPDILKDIGLSPEEFLDEYNESYEPSPEDAQKLRDLVYPETPSEEVPTEEEAGPEGQPSPEVSDEAGPDTGVSSDDAGPTPFEDQGPPGGGGPTISEQYQAMSDEQLISEKAKLEKEKPPRYKADVTVIESILEGRKPTDELSKLEKEEETQLKIMGDEKVSEIDRAKAKKAHEKLQKKIKKLKKKAKPKKAKKKAPKKKIEIDPEDLAMMEDAADTDTMRKVLHNINVDIDKLSAKEIASIPEKIPSPKISSIIFIYI